jgi:transcription termination factor Rho
MSSVLDRPGLEQSPLADLHLLAGELGVENFRRLRKADLIDAILARQEGAEPPAGDEEEPAGVIESEAAEDETRGRSRRGRRGGRGRGRARDEDRDDDENGDEAPAARAASAKREQEPAEDD